jgi:hypothetical protein
LWVNIRIYLQEATCLLVKWTLMLLPESSPQNSYARTVGILNLLPDALRNKNEECFLVNTAALNQKPA